jgi:hypothetical protein
MSRCVNFSALAASLLVVAQACPATGQTLPAYAEILAALTISIKDSRDAALRAYDFFQDFTLAGASK